MSTEHLCKFGFHGLYTPALFSVVVGIEENDSHWVKNVRIRRYPGPHFSRIFPQSNWMRKDTGYLSVFSSNARKCGKNAGHNNSDRDTFYAVSFYLLFLSHCVCLTDHQKDLMEKSEKFSFGMSGATLNSYMLNFHFV